MRWDAELNNEREPFACVKYGFEHGGSQFLIGLILAQAMEAFLEKTTDEKKAAR